MDARGNLLPLHKMPQKARKVISSMNVTNHVNGAVTYKYKFSSKGDSLARIEKMMGAFRDINVNVNHRGEVVAKVESNALSRKLDLSKFDDAELDILEKISDNIVEAEYEEVQGED